MSKMGKPMKGTEIVREGWFYLGTFLEDDKHGGDGTCTLIVRRAQLRRGPSGQVRSRIDGDALGFPNEDAMGGWIREHDATELPPEADGDPRYVPEGFRSDDIKEVAPSG